MVITRTGICERSHLPAEVKHVRGSIKYAFKDEENHKKSQPRLRAVKKQQSTVIIRLMGQSEEEAAGRDADKYADGGSCVGGDVTLISGTLQDSQMCPSQKPKD